MRDNHHSFKDLEKTVGYEEAKKLLVKRLREAADIIEANRGPIIYDCVLPKHDSRLCHGNEYKFSGYSVDTVEVTFSYPWGA